MPEWNQAPGPDPPSEPPFFPEPPFPLPPDPEISRARRGLLAWFFTLLVFGVLGVALNQPETAALVALAALLATAQAAEVDPRSRVTFQLVSWVVPVGTVATFVGMGALLGMGSLKGLERSLALGSTAVATAVGLALLIPGAANTLSRALFRTDAPTPTMTLSARLVVFGLLIAAPAWFSFDSMRDTFLAKPETLMDPSHLSGGLLGYILLAAGGVGWLVRRDLRATLSRLGIERVRPRDLLIVGLGVAALVALNAVGDSAQHRWFPTLWASDHDFTKAISRKLSPTQTLLLGMSAGVGEEITLRGALQPRLGLILTSLFFAALHVQYSWWGMLMILILGLILGTIRQRSSTTVAILVHAIYDMLAVLSE